MPGDTAEDESMYVFVRVSPLSRGPPVSRSRALPDHVCWRPASDARGGLPGCPSRLFGDDHARVTAAGVRGAQNALYRMAF